MYKYYLLLFFACIYILYILCSLSISLVFEVSVSVPVSVGYEEPKQEYSKYLSCLSGTISSSILFFDIYISSVSCDVLFIKSFDELNFVHSIFILVIESCIGTGSTFAYSLNKLVKLVLNENALS